MNKKLWLLAILTVTFLAGYALYRFNLIPQWTNLVNSALGYLTGTYNTSPATIIAGIGTTVTAITTGAKLLYDRGKSSLTGTYNLLVGEKDRQLENISNTYTSLSTKYDSLYGQFNATKTELESTKTTLAATQQKLNDALSQLQRRQDQINAVTQVKAQELRLAKDQIVIQDIIRKLGGNADPAQVKRAIEAAGRTATVA